MYIKITRLSFALVLLFSMFLALLQLATFCPVSALTHPEKSLRLMFVPTPLNWREVVWKWICIFFSFIIFINRLASGQGAAYTGKWWCLPILFESPICETVMPVISRLLGWIIYQLNTLHRFIIFELFISAWIITIILCDAVKLLSTINNIFAKCMVVCCD